MELKAAQTIAEAIIEQLKPHCDKVQIAGSIRRGRQFVHDIDIVCIPANQGQFYYALQQIGAVQGGKKILQVYTQGIMVDIYIATPETWATLLLIRTGSKAHNIKLCGMAKSRGMKLHADGSGLFEIDVAGSERRIAGDTEASIFQALGLAYRQPGERE
jgi:DNA polymerase (family 10)